MNPTLLYTLILYLAVMLPFTGQHQVVTLILSGTGLLLCLLLYKMKWQLPRWLKFGLMFISMAFILKSFGGLRGLEAGVGLLSILAVFKLFEMKGRRDFFIYILIMELLLVGHLLSVDSLFALIYVIVISLVLFYLLAAFNLGSNFDFNKERLKITLRVFLSSIPLALVLFFAFPRLYLGNLFNSSVKSQGTVGFDEKVRPGDFAEIVNTNEKVFRARIEGEAPSQYDMFWRGAVLSRTDGFNWFRGSGGNRHFYNFSENVKFTYRVDFDRLQVSPLFLLEGSSKVIRDSRGRLTRLAGRTFKMVPYNNQKIRYQAQVVETGAGALSERVKKLYLQLPEGMSEGVEELAKHLSGEKSFSEKVDAVQNHFFLQGYEYTLSPGRYHSVNALEDFLLIRKKGFCEHYASAAAILFRMMGIPARVVAGFQGGEFNPVGKYYLVQGRDAHAWVEIHHPKVGWKRIDPTSWIAPDRVRLGAAGYFLNLERPSIMSEEDFFAQVNNSFLRQFGFAVDMYYYELSRRFLGYDYETQKEFFRKIGFEYQRPIKLFMICLGVCFIVVGIMFYYHNKRKKNPLEWEESYSNFLNLLSKKGFDTGRFKGPLTLKNEFIGIYPENVAGKDVFDQYMMLKYGRPGEKKRVKLLLEAVREATHLIKQQV